MNPVSTAQAGQLGDQGRGDNFMVLAADFHLLTSFCLILRLWTEYTFLFAYNYDTDQLRLRRKPAIVEERVLSASSVKVEAKC